MNASPTSLKGRLRALPKPAHQGVWGFSFAFAFLIAPSGGTALYAWSPNALWITCAILGVIAAALVMTLPERVVQTDSAPTPVGPEVPGTQA